MANVSMIMGKSGTGKSTSIKTLDPKETVVVNVLRKRLPFKGSGSLYNEDNKNLFNVKDAVEIVNLLKNINDKAPHVKNVIIDDATYIMRGEYFKTANQAGFQKFVTMAQHFQAIIAYCEEMRPEVNVFIIMHAEDVSSDKVITTYKASTVGNMVDASYNPVEVVPVLLFSDVKFDDKGNASYGFYTHRSMNGAVTIPAKSPDGMFEEDFIPNDLGYVIKKYNEYYG